MISYVQISWMRNQEMFFFFFKRLNTTCYNEGYGVDTSKEVDCKWLVYGTGSGQDLCCRSFLQIGVSRM